MTPTPLLRQQPASTNTPHSRQYQHLSPSQIATWMQYGFVHVPGAFSRQAAADRTRDIWVRLGFDPDDQRTWTKEITHMPNMEERSVKVAEFAPKALGAICDLVGGEDRIEGGEEEQWWDDGFIVNVGKDQPEETNDENILRDRNADGWHVDGDFFVHFLDSREQGLLIVPLWSDVIENGGGTIIAADSIGKVGKWLHAHPEGVNESLAPLQEGQEDRWYADEFARDCTDFFELTGEPGDVYILHPFMIHSAATNSLRIPRFITNPNVCLKEPFNYNRSNAADYSLIEMKTLKDLGQDNLGDWKVTGQRRELIPVRVGEEEENQRIQNERVEAAAMEAQRRRYLELAERAPPLPPRNYLRTYPREFYGQYV